ncbi:MAG: hypothetical protein E7319_02215 [Clostridiales bacterium]|nr:hypothetical protein [Clostridiales bacterium]
MERVRWMDLQLFAEGGGDGAASANAAGTAAPAGEQTTVIYGKQEGTAMPETQPEAPQAPQPEAESFDSLINGKYKEDFTQKAQQMIDTRFKQTKKLEQEREALRPVLDALSARYGVDMRSKDFAQQLQAAIDEDDGFYEQEADRLGLTVPQLKEQRRITNENAQLREALAERERQEARDNVYKDWVEQGEKLKAVYPEFRLDVEAQNEGFVRLLQNGIDVKTAYEVVHKDELLSGAIRYAVQTAQQRTVEDIRARGMRPQEAGAGNSTAAAKVVKADPKDWTDEDMREATRRAMMGEKIRL